MNKNRFRKGKARQLTGDFISLVLMVILDQVTKYFAVLHLKGQKPYIIWDGVFELHYLENRGAAFGMLQNGKVFFIFAAVIMMTMMIYVFGRVPTDRKYFPWHVFLCLIGAGGIGNLIDRLRIEYVIDFLYFKLIDFPIFNVADIYVTVGTILLLLFLIFVWKEEDLRFLSLKYKNNPLKQEEE